LVASESRSKIIIRNSQMGIRNLLQLVREAINTNRRLSDYADRTIGIDIYSW
jgi:hypothetical protein